VLEAQAEAIPRDLTGLIGLFTVNRATGCHAQVQVLITQWGSDARNSSLLGQ
jgi:hypothetical protein